MITNQTSTTGSPHRLGRRQLEMIADQLDHIDHRLLSLLRTHRYATTRQLSDISRLATAYASARSALRQTTRRLNRHRHLGLVDHLERRIGGVRAGSTGYIWHLREPGHRLVAPERTTRHRTNQARHRRWRHYLLPRPAPGRDHPAERRAAALLPGCRPGGRHRVPRPGKPDHRSGHGAARHRGLLCPLPAHHHLAASRPQRRGNLVRQRDPGSLPHQARHR